VSDGPKKLGWQALHEPDADPDPDRRAWTRPGPEGRIDAMLMARRGPSRLAEEVIPLFATPPDFCDRLRRTLLYGVVPVASPDRSAAPQPVPDYARLPEPELSDLRRHLFQYLKERRCTPTSLASSSMASRSMEERIRASSS
jgi:hypothetical protein